MANHISSYFHFWLHQPFEPKKRKNELQSKHSLFLQSQPCTEDGVTEMICVTRHALLCLFASWAPIFLAVGWMSNNVTKQPPSCCILLRFCATMITYHLTWPPPIGPSHLLSLPNAGCILTIQLYQVPPTASTGTKNNHMKYFKMIYWWLLFFFWITLWLPFLIPIVLWLLEINSLKKY